jgi:hypothetical protein
MEKTPFQVRKRTMKKLKFIDFGENSLEKIYD